MAADYQIPKDWLGKVKGSAAEAKQRIAAANRQRAEAASEPLSRILGVKDIQTGKWDANRVLETTLGGVQRAITRQDLAAFRQNISTVKSNFVAGVTAQQIINLSREIDRKRANDQIKMAVPVSASKGRVRFITNAGGETPGVHRHHVMVEFLDFGKEAAAADTKPRQAALNLRKSPLKIECDCGRWRFWYKYVATIGGYNAGSPETGFPKIRNPGLTGIACKHLLRVMHEITVRGSVLNFIAQQLEKAKGDDLSRARSTTEQAQAETIAKQQNQRRTSHEIKIKQIRDRVITAVKTTQKPKKAAQKSKPIPPAAQIAADPHAQLRALLKAAGQSESQIEAMIRASIENEGK